MNNCEGINPLTTRVPDPTRVVIEQDDFDELQQ